MSREIPGRIFCSTGTERTRSTKPKSASATNSGLEVSRDTPAVVTIVPAGVLPQSGSLTGKLYRRVPCLSHENRSMIVGGFSCYAERLRRPLPLLYDIIGRKIPLFCVCFHKKLPLLYENLMLSGSEKACRISSSDLEE